MRFLKEKLKHKKYQLFLSNIVNFGTTFTYNKQKKVVKEVSEDNAVEYVYNKKGLLISCNNRNKGYSFISKFVYSKE